MDVFVALQATLKWFGLQKSPQEKNRPICGILLIACDRNCQSQRDSWCYARPVRSVLQGRRIYQRTVEALPRGCPETNRGDVVTKASGASGADQGKTSASRLTGQW